MEFEIIRRKECANIMVQYSINNRSFDCIPASNVDINIAMAYLNLGIDSEDMCVKCFWGFSPKESWQKKILTVPFAESGMLKLKGEYAAGLTWRIDKDRMWESYFDMSSGWYCLGEILSDKEDRTVKIHKNMLVVLNNKNFLKSIWVKPEFI